MQHAKIVETRKSPRILAQSCITPPYIIQAKGLRMSILDRMGFPCLHNFLHGAAIPTSPFIPLNDFCTCIIMLTTSRVGLDKLCFSYCYSTKNKAAVELAI